MMKRSIVVSAVLAFAVAVTGCGSSSDNGGTNGSTGLTGTISGTPFTEADAAALLASGDSCSLSVSPSVALGVSMAVAEVTNVAGVCGGLAGCSLHKNSANVVIMVARAKPGVSGTAVPAPGLATGTYTLADLSNLGSLVTVQPDSEGAYRVFAASVVNLGATCQPTPTAVAAGSTLSITSSSATGISGTVNLTLANGAGSITGNFTASTCPSVPTGDACALLNGIVSGGGTGNSTCTPSNTTCS